MREYFSALYGNSATKARLGNAIDTETLPHAFLVTGAEGSGKKTLAREFSQALNCEERYNEKSPLPCHKCNTCRRIGEWNFTDIKRLRRSDGKVTIGVEEIRLFREDMFLSPVESKHKIYIIEEAEKLTPNAQNALLTVLEEPPKNVVILLLAESGDKMLTTVKSRAQSIAMQRHSTEKLKNYLVLNNNKANLYSKTENSALDGILMSADGRIGRALSLLSDKEADGNDEKRRLTDRIIRALRPSTPYSELYSAISELPTSRADFTEALELLICAIRDIILLKFDSKAELLFYTSYGEAADASKDMNTKRLIRVYEILKEATEDAAKNVSTSAVITSLGAQIRFI